MDFFFLKHKMTKHRKGHLQQNTAWFTYFFFFFAVRKENISSRNRFVDPYHQQQGADKILSIITIKTQTARAAHQISIFSERVLWVRRKRGPQPRALRWLGPSHEGDQQAVYLTSVLVCSVYSVTLSTFPQTFSQSRSALRSKWIIPSTLPLWTQQKQPAHVWCCSEASTVAGTKYGVMLFATSSPSVENIYKYWRLASAVQNIFNWSCPTPAKAIRELHVLSI